MVSAGGTAYWGRHGAAGLLSAKRGKPSNRRLPQELRWCALELIRAHYDLAHEKLTEQHGLKLSVETLRGGRTLGGVPRWLVSAERGCSREIQSLQPRTPPAAVPGWPRGRHRA